MQERTINNALLVLRKEGGLQGKLAEILLDMRDVPLPGWYQDKPFKRGDTKRLVLSELSGGPMTNSELGRVVQKARPDTNRRAAANRTYQCLLRLEAEGVVRREGRVWKLAP